MILPVFVPWSEIVPRQVRWFWEAVEVGRVPWIYADKLGQYDADPEETPFILCAEPAERAVWAVGLLQRARTLPG